MIVGDVKKKTKPNTMPYLLGFVVGLVLLLVLVLLLGLLIRRKCSITKNNRAERTDDQTPAFANAVYGVIADVSTAPQSPQRTCPMDPEYETSKINPMFDPSDIGEGAIGPKLPLYSDDDKKVPIGMDVYAVDVPVLPSKKDSKYLPNMVSVDTIIDNKVPLEDSFISVDPINPSLSYTGLDNMVRVPALPPYTKEVIIIESRDDMGYDELAKSSSVIPRPITLELPIIDKINTVCANEMNDNVKNIKREEVYYSIDDIDMSAFQS